MLTGVVLAGGKNDILCDTPKSFLSISERSTIEYQLHEMRKVCKEIIIVTNTPQSFVRNVPRDIRIVTDYYKNCGVLGGMYSALSLSQNPFVWITACGMPFISSRAAAYMSRLCQDRKTDAVLPVLYTKIHPFHGVYDKRILPAVKEHIRCNNGSLSLEDLVKKLSWIGVSEKELYSMNIPELIVFNIKHAKDYETAKNLARQISFC